MTDDLKIIKRKYGEKMAHFCREEFSSLLEQPGKLSQLLLDNFHESHCLYDDIIDTDNFIDFIYSLASDNSDAEVIVSDKTPEELMEQAGYILKECHTEEEIQSYRKYYAKGEELCTFRGNRLNRCRVFFAVKKNVDEIKRENFPKPERQDEYGTSVISIQFTKNGSNTLSIKNRYNHNVDNPDATFSNNLDNIIDGLTQSFEVHKGILQNYKNHFEMSGYIRASDGRYYKYNYEINNIYYCPDNIIIDNFEVKKYGKSRYLIVDYFIIDMANKTIECYDKDLSDSFCGVVGNIQKIEVVNVDNGKKIKITGDRNVEVLVNNNNEIVSFSSDDVDEIGDNFLYFNDTLVKISLPNVIRVGNKFLNCNRELEELFFPNLRMVGDDFLYLNMSLEELSLPCLITVGNRFLNKTRVLYKVFLPNLTTVGDGFLQFNRGLRELSLLSLTTVGDEFLSWNVFLVNLSLPNLTIVGKNFLFSHEALGEKILAEVELRKKSARGSR